VVRPYALVLHSAVDDRRVVVAAVVCGAKSCPAIKTYRASDVDDALTTATEAFFEVVDGGGNLQLNPPRREVKLSRILDWYRVDFARTDEVRARACVAWLAAAGLSASNSTHPVRPRSCSGGWPTLCRLRRPRCSVRGRGTATARSPSSSTTGVSTRERPWGDDRKKYFLYKK